MAQFKDLGRFLFHVPAGAIRMPNCRPPISPRHLDDEFRVISQGPMPDGCNNAGILKVERRNGLKCVEKRFGVEDILEGKAEYEMKILRSLKHRNIVEFVVASMVLNPRSEPSASLYMERCDMGTLEDSFKSHYR